MPSPSDTTVPTSATSTATPKLPICSRIILEISSAFMLILSSQLSAFSLQLLLHQLLTHLLELRLDAAVVHRAADSRDHAAEQPGIDARGYFNLLAGDLREALFE